MSATPGGALDLFLRSEVLQAVAAFVPAVLAALALVVWRWRRGELSFSLRYKRTHLIPVVLQLCIYAYWARYYPFVAERIPSFLMQIGFAYLLELVFSMAAGGRFALSMAPLPVVLSANLFLWFSGRTHYLSFVMVFLAISSKALLRRDGSHLFNPSAFAITVLGVFCLAFPGVFHYDDLSLQLAVAPYMPEWIFALSAVPHVLLGTVLVPFGASLTMLSVDGVWSGPPHPASPIWPAHLLSISLLATDPETIPRTGPGRLLYGMLVGLMIACGSLALALAGFSDFFSKVFPIPVANLLRFRCDALAEKVSGRLREALALSRKPIQLALWALVFVVMCYGFGWKNVEDARWTEFGPRPAPGGEWRRTFRFAAQSAPGLRVPLPWAVGDSIGTSTIDRIERHPEFVRLQLDSASASGRSVVEIRYGAGPVDPWSTRLYRVQPAPGASPSVETLQTIHRQLTRLEGRVGHRPFVARQ